MFHWPVAINCSSVLPALERKCLLSGTLARPGSQGAVPPAQEHSLPQDSCIATTAIQEGATVPPAAFPPALSFWLSTEHLTPEISWCNIVNHHGKCVPDSSQTGLSCTPHMDCRKLCHRELCPGAASALGIGQGSATASLFLRAQRQLPGCP